MLINVDQTRHLERLACCAYPCFT